MKNTASPIQLELQKVIKQITAHLSIDEIYLQQYTTLRPHIFQLYILIQNITGQGVLDARAICELAIAESPTIRCFVCYANDFRKKIMQGNIRAKLICQPSKMIYENPHKKDWIDSTAIDIPYTLHQAEQYYTKEMAKILAFEEGYGFYLQRKNFSQASFMMHQTIELAYRTAENIIIGKEKISHSIRNHQEYILPYSREIGFLFQKPNETSIRGRLDDAYKAARYDHDFELSPEDLFIAFVKAKELIAYIISFQEQLIREIQQLSHPQRNTLDLPLLDILENIILETSTGGKVNESKQAPNHQHIVEAIQKCIVVDNIYCFAYQKQESFCTNLLLVQSELLQTHRYYILLLTPKEITLPLDRQQQINDALTGEVEVICLFFTTADFVKQISQGKRFHNQIIRNSEQWISQVDMPSEPIAAMEVAESAEIKAVWEYHFRNAKGLMEMSKNHLGCGWDQGITVVVGQALEQLCLGLLYSFWGYRPANCLNLIYLIRLSESITPLVKNAFSLDIPEERKEMIQLAEALHEFRYNSHYQSTSSNLCIVNDRLESLLEQLKKFADNHFESITTVGKTKYPNQTPSSFVHNTQIACPLSDT